MGDIFNPTRKAGVRSAFDIYVDILCVNEEIVLPYKTFKQWANENIVLYTNWTSNGSNWTRIHPFRQKVVHSISSNKTIQQLCKTVFLFGSAANSSCSRFSDVDLAIELFENNESSLNQVCHAISAITRGVCYYDLILLNDLNLEEESRLYKNILEGLVIWPRQNELPRNVP